MNENRYKSAIATTLGLSKELLPDHPSKKAITDLAMASVEASYDMSNPIIKNVLTKYMEDRHISPLQQQEVILDGLQNSRTIITCEIVGLYESVCIHVKDRELVEALLRSDIDAVAGDARLPFPVMEITYPEGIMIDDVYQASGSLIVDYKAINFRKWFNGIAKFGSLPAESGRTMARYMCLVKLRKVDGSYDDTNLIKKFDESFDLNMGHTPADLSQDEIRGMEIHTRLAWALFLYLQGVDKNKVMSLDTGRQHMTGITSKLAKIYKGQKHYSITDIISHPHSHEERITGKTHASPETHWRKGHIRSLRDERYHRNPDNSIRTIWVRPVKINQDDSVMVRAERKLEPVVAGNV